MEEVKRDAAFCKSLWRLCHGSISALGAGDLERIDGIMNAKKVSVYANNIAG